MTVRLRFRRSPARRPAPVPAASQPPTPPGVVTRNEIAMGLASLLSPVIALLMIIGCWRLAQDLGLMGNFFIETGALSHWQSWIGMALLLGLAGGKLNRTGRHDDGSAAAN